MFKGDNVTWLLQTSTDPKRRTPPYRPYGSNVRQTCAVLNGILQGLPLNATSLMLL